MPVLRDGELYLYGVVGETFWGEGFTASDVQDALTEVGRNADITAHINSGGGYVDDGVAIYNAFVAHKGKVTMIVDGMAASAASVIFMAGDERIMNAGTMLMIHDPSSIVWGTAEDMGKSQVMLDKQGDEMAAIYADRTGDDPADIRAEMREEIWLTGDEARERGFATNTSEQSASTAAAFDYRVYAHAPRDLRSLAQAQSWSIADATAQHISKRGKAAAPKNSQHEEIPMSEKDGKPAAAKAGIPEAEHQAAVDAASAEGAKAERDRLSGVLGAEGIKGDGKRMAAALDLATKSPGMSVEDVTAFVTGNITEAKAEGDPAANYEAGRMSAAGLATPAPAPQAKGRSLNSGDVYASRRDQVRKD